MEKGVKPQSTLKPEEAAELARYRQLFTKDSNTSLETPLVSSGRLGIDYQRYHDLMIRSGRKIIVIDPVKSFFKG